MEWVVVGIIVAVIFFFFGAKRLPDIVRSLRRTPSEFKRGMAEGEAETSDDAEKRD